MNKKIIPYLTAYVVILLVSCALLLMYPKAELHLMLNSWHTRVGDIFFKYYTKLAEWPLYVIAVIPLFFHKWRWTAFYALCEVVAAVIVTAIKWNYDIPRPVPYFSNIPNAHLPLVQGVAMHSTSTFPSGHACTFFIFFTVAAILLATYYKKSGENLSHRFQNTAIQQTTLLALLMLAIFGGFSRVYLSQHFISDIAAGSLIGVIVPCMMFLFFGKKILRKVS